MTNPPLLDHAAIAARIPHAGDMCLLDQVTFWDTHRIVCSATSHQAAHHPLRAADGSLGIAAGIEYAAQAMAVHGSLLAEQAEQAAQGAAGGAAKPPSGLLASVRAVELHARCLDDAAPQLCVEATRIASDAQALAYAFALYAVWPAGAAAEALGKASEARRLEGRAAIWQPARALLLNGRASVLLLPGAR